MFARAYDKMCFALWCIESVLTYPILVRLTTSQIRQQPSSGAYWVVPLVVSLRKRYCMSSRNNSVKLKLCICGKSGDIIHINKDKYHNTALFVLLGVLASLIGLTLLPFGLARGYRPSGWVWFEVVAIISMILFIGWQTSRMVAGGHSIFCSMRRVNDHNGAKYGLNRSYVFQ
jgi:hypothetical protein